MFRSSLIESAPDFGSQCRLVRNKHIKESKRKERERDMFKPTCTIWMRLWHRIDQIQLVRYWSSIKWAAIEWQYVLLLAHVKRVKLSCNITRTHTHTHTQSNSIALIGPCGEYIQEKFMWQVHIQQSTVSMHPIIDPAMNGTGLYLHNSNSINYITNLGSSSFLVRI